MGLTRSLAMKNKIGRNQLCPCGSGLKYKRCHGRLDVVAPASFPPASNPGQLLDRVLAAERIRQTQQGLGRPIVSAKLHDHQMVAVNDTAYFSRTWRTFPDFLADYMRRKLDPGWGNAEIAKPFAERHPILQWHDAYCRYQQETIKKPGEVHTGKVIGVVACYLGLAYALYLLDHNVELQERLIRRLKDRANFQGAYYELIVASTLIRAGFTLTLEDEADGDSKHCEFAAVSGRTGKKYWVEAKMRSIAGLLGKTDKDGGADGNPVARLISHLNGALAKPAADERLIFIDLNAVPEFDANGKPAWFGSAVARLESYETKELAPGVSAYVFVTNIGFHRQLADDPMIAAAPFGLGMPDFNRPGSYRVSEAYRRKQKHIDAYHIGDALLHYLRFPSTFDGSLPSEAFCGRGSRVTIGETYHFTDVGENGVIGTVTSATVSEDEKVAYIAITVQGQNSQILRQPMSDDELADYKAHSDAYFGQVVPVKKKLNDHLELFEWLMDVNKRLSRAQLLENLSKSPRFDELKDLSDNDLLIEYCEGMTAGFAASMQNAPIAGKGSQA
jgi:SEC-C motif